MTLLDANGKRTIRVAIATPSQDTVHAGYAKDLVMLVAFMCGTRPDIKLAMLQNKGTIIPQQRATLVRMAMETEATHVLWIDSDMRFPKDALLRLLEHQQPIVAANYSTRRQPILPTAEDQDRGYLFTPDDADGLVQVTRCGMGLMLVDMAVYQTMPQPWFVIGFNKKDNEYSGEDFFFCHRSKQYGFKTMIDQDLSKEVRHAGEMEWTSGHAITTRDVYLNPPVTTERTLTLVGND